MQAWRQAPNRISRDAIYLKYGPGSYERRYNELKDLRPDLSEEDFHAIKELAADENKMDALFVLDSRLRLLSSRITRLESLRSK